MAAYSSRPIAPRLSRPSSIAIAPLSQPAEAAHPCRSLPPKPARSGRRPRRVAYRRHVIKVCFAGITGWTAPPIVRAIVAADDLVLTAGVSRSAAGQSLEGMGASGTGVVHASVIEALEAAPVDVLVDFTSATAVKGHVIAAVDAGVHVVIGSSGLTAEDYVEIDRRARGEGVGVFAAGNFSIMAAVLQRAAQMAAQHLHSWEILDYASDTKADVPSGTARELAETLGQVRVRGRQCHTGTSTDPSRPGAPTWLARVSIPCGSPASWSVPRLSSGAEVSG